MVCGLGALSGKSFGWNGGLLAESWPDRLLSYLAVGGWRLAAGGRRPSRRLEQWAQPAGSPVGRAADGSRD